MKLRTGMLLGIVALVAAIVASTAAAVVYFVSRAEDRKLREDLDRSEAVFREQLSYRAAKFRSDCHVVANEPRAINVLGTQDISRETIVGRSICCVATTARMRGSFATTWQSERAFAAR